jgi:hypothetical protein
MPGAYGLWAAVSWMWAQGLLSTLPTVVLNALIISILHEMVRYVSRWCLHTGSH